VLLDLVPSGLEETDGDGEIELAVYGDERLERTLRRSFARVEATDVPDGWADAWRRFHQPVLIGSLWIGPSWVEPTRDVLPVVIDPGQAFGTGAHATTRLCLELLLELEPCSVADFGCGSGVLAIAAAKLGFRPTYAFDREAPAVEAARTNARANGVDVDVRLADVLADELPEVELGLANLELELVERLGERTAPETLVVAGFLARDRVRLPDWRRLERRERDGWAAELVTRRRS
jgi:ribosomal protein L11 methyltransferase